MLKLHSMKSSVAVNLMLIKLYQPFLWRSLHSANADVRANAAQLFFDSLPLVDVTRSKQECEESLQKQFDLIVVSVRAVRGVWGRGVYFTVIIPEPWRSDAGKVEWRSL